ncbi:MAG: hypothetical protein ACRCTZ_22545 [Sarcina sp.]
MSYRLKPVINAYNLDEEKITKLVNKLVKIDTTEMIDYTFTREQYELLLRYFIIVNKEMVQKVWRYYFLVSVCRKHGLHTDLMDILVDKN